MPEEASIQTANETTTLVAIGREDFGVARERLLLILGGKAAEHRELAHDLRESIVVAKRNKWASASLKRAFRNAERTAIYYENAVEAVTAGYLLAPNLPADVYAVRTCGDSLPGDDSHLHWPPMIPLMTADTALPAGEGEYVSDIPVVDRYKLTEIEGDREVRRHYVTPTALKQPEALFILARPKLMEAAERAMALKIFDEIGIVGATRRNRRGDPLLVGRIVHPVTRGKMMSFFIAWFLDPRTL